VIAAAPAPERPLDLARLCKERHARLVESLAVHNLDVLVLLGQVLELRARSRGDASILGPVEARAGRPAVQDSGGSVVSPERTGCGKIPLGTA